MNKNYRMNNFVKGEAAFRVDREDIETFLKECDVYNLHWRSGDKASEYNPFRTYLDINDNLTYIVLTDRKLTNTTDRSDIEAPIIYDYKAHLKEINDKTYNFTKLLNEVRVITNKLYRAERALCYIDDLDNVKNFDIVSHRNDFRNVDVDLNSEEDIERVKDTLKDIKQRELNREAMAAIELICELARELDRVTDIDISSEEGDE